MNDNLATIGHNAPPDPIQELKDLLFAETIKERNNITVLDAQVSRITEITDEVAAAAATDLLSQIQKATKDYDKKRDDRKRPFMSQSNAVQDFFKDGLNQLDVLKAKISRPLTSYAKKKADEERERQAEISRQLQAEAEEKARKARELEKVGLPEHAEVQMREAVKIEAQAIKAGNQTTAQLSTVRGVSAMSGLRKRWVAEIFNKDELDLERLRPYLKPEHLQVALNAYMNAGGRVIKGGRIFEAETINVR